LAKEIKTATVDLVPIQNLVREFCEQSSHPQLWDHIVRVDKHAQDLMKVYEANAEVVRLGAYLHSISYVDGIIVGSSFYDECSDRAGEILEAQGYCAGMIEVVRNIIATHHCDNVVPSTIEGKILASSDAMSHFTGDILWTSLLRHCAIAPFSDAIRFLRDKIKHDFANKIFFPEAKDYVRHQYNAWMVLLDTFPRFKYSL